MKNPNVCLYRFITIDETWVHHFTPRTKQQRKQWVEAGGPTPKKVKTISASGKVVASVFSGIPKGSF